MDQKKDSEAPLCVLCIQTFAALFAQQISVASHHTVHPPPAASTATTSRDWALDPVSLPSRPAAPSGWRRRAGPSATTRRSSGSVLGRNQHAPLPFLMGPPPGRAHGGDPRRRAPTARQTASRGTRSAAPGRGRGPAGPLPERVPPTLAERVEGASAGACHRRRGRVDTARGGRRHRRDG